MKCYKIVIMGFIKRNHWEEKNHFLTKKMFCYLFKTYSQVYNNYISYFQNQTIGNKPSVTIVEKEKQVYETLRQLQGRSKKKLEELKVFFKKQFGGNSIQMKQDSKVMTGGENLKKEIGEEMNKLKSISWGKNYQCIQEEITSIVTQMKKYSHGTSSTCHGYFPVIGKFGICIAAYGIYFEKIHANCNGKISQSESISYLFGTYQYKPEGGWTKAKIGTLIEASSLSEDAKEINYNSLVEKLLQNNGQKQIGI